MNNPILYTNTTVELLVAFLMSRSLVVAFHETLTRKPWLRLIGVDWLMNKLFITMANDGSACACTHADPTTFKHGTTTGDYVAWKR